MLNLMTDQSFVPKQHHCARRVWYAKARISYTRTLVTDRPGEKGHRLVFLGCDGEDSTRLVQPQLLGLERFGTCVHDLPREFVAALVRNRDGCGSSARGR